MDKHSSVFKFGGSSVKDATSIKNCAEIILDSPECKLVVVSATQNTTNQLENLYEFAGLQNNNDAWSIFREIMNRHDQIAEELGVRRGISSLLKNLALEARAIVEKLLLGVNKNDQTMDQLYSIGERLSSTIVSSYLDTITLDKSVKLWDARSILKTNSCYKEAKPLLFESFKSSNYLRKFIELGSTIGVTQGFIGGTLSSETTTLGREGSDYSATLFAELLGIRNIYIMTDVEGVASCDPRVVENPSFLKTLSYDQATTMAEKGASVLFPRTLLPAKRSKANVYVGSTHKKIINGTKISEEKSEALVTGITTQENILSIVGNNLGESLSNDIEALLKKSSIEFEVWEQAPEYISYLIKNNSLKDCARLVHSHLF